MFYQLEQFESRLKELFDEVDDYLEETYGDRFPLHPSRAQRGTTSNKESNGLFNVGAAFSAGYGSKHGRGYVIDIEMVTLSVVSDEVEDEIETAAVEYVRLKLPFYFPDRNLEVKRDRHTFKISGDLSLGLL
ncbi:MAG TPA: hypothetical protein VMW69_10385 [Spirochaetia bacterium]|nr:hypothetical protein [Spirochaetia bacterium]